MTFRPLLWPTLFSVPAVLFMLALGFWQVERLAWKTALLAHIHGNVAAPPLDIAAAAADPAGSEYRRVRVRGEFLHDKELYLAARSLRGNVGYEVVTPLRLESGEVVLINRGWIPEAWRNPFPNRIAGQLAGKVEITGILRQAQQRRWLQPENSPERNVWFFYDVPAMRRAVGEGAPKLAGLDRLVLEADATANPGGSPVGGQTRVDIPNDHLQYAITWFSLAIALVVIYLAYHHKNGRLRLGRRPAGPAGR